FVPFTELFALLQHNSGVPAPRWHLPYAAALVLATALEGWSRLSGRPVLITRAAVQSVYRRNTTRSAKAMRELGASLRPFAETIRDEVAWYQANQPKQLPPQLAPSVR
ncbi:hypothetical protein SE17_37630, partial [Kouleothrix aurantiaca]